MFDYKKKVLENPNNDLAVDEALLAVVFAMPEGYFKNVTQGALLGFIGSIASNISTARNETKRRAENESIYTTDHPRGNFYLGVTSKRIIAYRNKTRKVPFGTAASYTPEKLKSVTVDTSKRYSSITIELIDGSKLFHDLNIRKKNILEFTDALAKLTRTIVDGVDSEATEAPTTLAERYDSSSQTDENIETFGQFVFNGKLNVGFFLKTAFISNTLLLANHVPRIGTIRSRVELRGDTLSTSYYVTFVVIYFVMSLVLAYLIERTVSYRRSK